MKKIKLLNPLNIAVFTGALTILSSFISGSKFGLYCFYRTSGACRSTNKSDYQYICSPLAGCDVSSCICQICFNQETVPSCGDHPTSTAVVVSIVDGTYNGQ